MLAKLRVITLVEKAELRPLGDAVVKGITSVLNVEPVVRWYRGPPIRPFMNPRRGQCDAERLLEALRAKYRVSEGERLIAILDCDAYVEGLNFVFGIAAPNWGGVVFLERLKPEFYGQSASPALLQNRVLKVSLHELGHSLGLRHCTNRRCVMWFDNTVYEVDAKRARFCVSCTLALETMYPGLVKIYA